MVERVGVDHGAGRSANSKVEHDRGLWIRVLRQRLGVTQQVLGELIETNRNEISYYEAGKRTPVGFRREFLLLLADALTRLPRHEVWPQGEFTMLQRWRHILTVAVAPPVYHRVRTTHVPPASSPLTKGP